MNTSYEIGITCTNDSISEVGSSPTWKAEIPMLHMRISGPTLEAVQYRYCLLQHLTRKRLDLVAPALLSSGVSSSLVLPRSRPSRYTESDVAEAVEKSAASMHTGVILFSSRITLMIQCQHLCDTHAT